LADLLKSITPVSDQADSLLESSDSVGAPNSVLAETAYIHLTGLEDHYSLKKIWAYGIMLIMAGMLIFQSTLLGLVGDGVWSFKDYRWLLPALLVQNLAQIAGLAYIVVKALFNSTSPEPVPQNPHRKK
jgi:hypothetical protein